MHNEHHSAPAGHGGTGHGTAEQNGYELSDLQLRITLYAGITLVLLTFIAYVASTFMIRYANAQPPISNFELTPMAVEAQSQPFGDGVRLQVVPRRGLAELRQNQQQRATTYSVVSDEPEIYRIPVETALDIVVERGLPSFPVLTTPEQPAGETEQQ